MFFVTGFVAMIFLWCDSRFIQLWVVIKFVWDICIVDIYLFQGQIVSKYLNSFINFQSNKRCEEVCLDS